MRKVYYWAVMYQVRKCKCLMNQAVFAKLFYIILSVLLGKQKLDYLYCPLRLWIHTIILNKLKGKE
jgi:hypothetical protein